MIIVSENPIIQEFFEDLGLRFNPRMDIALKNFIYGLLVNERASIKNIAENTIQGQNERQMNRAIHELSTKSDVIFQIDLIFNTRCLIFKSYLFLTKNITFNQKT